MSFLTCRANSTHFKTLVEEQSVFEALSFINSKSAFRFTALDVFEGPNLRNICLIDKENNAVRQMETIKIDDSYCLFVRDSGEKFVTIDSLNDERVQDHPKRATVQSYCGMPLINIDGATLGAVCHFSLIPLDDANDEAILLEMVSTVLVNWIEDTFRTMGTVICPCCEGTGRVSEDKLIN